MQTPVKLYTTAEFDTFLTQPEHQARLFELIDGEITEKMPTLEHGVIVLRIGARLMLYVDEHGLGWVAVEARHQLPDDPHNVRQPDVSFTANSPLVTQGAVQKMPDLAVEVKSPDDTYLSQRRRADYYIAHGTRLVWLIYPEKRLVEVYQPGEDVQLLNDADTLEGGALLPGFTLAVRAIFP